MQMKANIFSTGGFLLCCICAAGIAQANSIKLASLAQINGKVLVDKGKGFVTAKSGMALGAKDRVITLNDSSAAVVYSNGCMNKLKSNSLLTLDKELGCNKQSLSIQATEKPLRYAQAIGATVTDVPATAGATGTSGATGTAGVAGGALAGNTVFLGFAGVMGGMIGYSETQDDSPVSAE
jgi:hypothetical protein